MYNLSNKSCFLHSNERSASSAVTIILTSLSSHLVHRMYGTLIHLLRFESLERNARSDKIKTPLYMVCFLYIHIHKNLILHHPQIFLHLHFDIIPSKSAKHASGFFPQTSGSYHPLQSLPSSQSPYHTRYLCASLEHPS